MQKSDILIDIFVPVVDSRKTVSGKESDKSKGMKTTLNSSKSLSSVRKSSENPDCREPTDVIKQSLSGKYYVGIRV